MTGARKWSWKSRENTRRKGGNLAILGTEAGGTLFLGALGPVLEEILQLLVSRPPLKLVLSHVTM